MWNMDTAHAIKVRTPVKRIECLWTPLGIMPNSLSRFYFSFFYELTTKHTSNHWLPAWLQDSVIPWKAVEENEEAEEQKTENYNSASLPLSSRLPVVNLLELFHTLWAPISIRFSLFCLHVTWFIFDIHVSCLINNIGDGEWEGKIPFCLVWFEYIYTGSFKFIAVGAWLNATTRNACSRRLVSPLLLPHIFHSPPHLWQFSGRIKTNFN